MQSLLQKFKFFIASFFAGNANNKISGDEGETGGKTGGDTGKAKISGTGFIDPKDPNATRVNQDTQSTAVKDPETILYNELKKNPAAMHALKKLINGQIPSSEAAEQFEKIRNSDLALEKIANSPSASSEIKSKAQAELQRRRLQPGDEIRKPQPPRPNPF